MTYAIIKFYADPNKHSKILKSGLSKDQAKEICNSSESHSGPSTEFKNKWFYGYTKD